MDLDKLVKSRKSIRDYEDKEVKHEVICEILDTAKYSPSADNLQNWVFIVIQDKKKMERLASSCLGQTWIAEAPALIVVCYDTRNAKALFPKKAKEFSIQNTTIATTYMMLKATELGLGTCWVDISDQKEASNCLKLVPFLTPSHLLTLGYQKGPYKKTKRNEIKLITYFEEFGRTKREKDLSTFPLGKHQKKPKKKK